MKRLSVKEEEQNVIVGLREKIKCWVRRIISVPQPSAPPLLKAAGRVTGTGV